VQPEDWVEGSIVGYAHVTVTPNLDMHDVVETFEESVGAVGTGDSRVRAGIEQVEGTDTWVGTSTLELPLKPCRVGDFLALGTSGHTESSRSRLPLREKV
jgi:hypothetical protein